MACIAGLLYGGVNSSRLALVDFMERNQASIFENHIDAKVSDIIDKYRHNWSNYGFETQTVKRKVCSFSNADVSHAFLWSSFVNIITPKWLKMSKLKSYYT